MFPECYLHPALSENGLRRGKHPGTNSGAGVVAPGGCGGQVITAQERGGPEKGIPAVPKCLPSFTEGGMKQLEKLRRESVLGRAPKEDNPSSLGSRLCPPWALCVALGKSHISISP